jgi:hypothetical protein
MLQVDFQVLLQGLFLWRYLQYRVVIDLEAMERGIFIHSSDSWKP